MMKAGIFKNILAAAGAVFIALSALTAVIALISIGGSLSREKVAVVKLEGIITDPADITREIKSYEERDDVRAVVIRINSPGGAVGPSQEIYSEIKRLRKKKPVVASMGAIAASGGYYAAVGADRIVANPGTITGSIGVLVEFVNASELLNKIGLKGYVVKSGKFKDTGSPFRKMEASETALLQSVINDVNKQFAAAVADGRKMKIEDVVRIADGRIFTGAQAIELGLVDALGDLTDAINLGAELSGIKGKPFVIYPEKKISLFRAFMGSEMPSSLTELFSGLRIMYMMPQP
ncbi:MAG: signal peptide peptidase SppA [Deltaproteobacteria bacterium]|nr:signal peptide peptidase SppA [Deltaproteobacteria bacterium]